MSKIVFSNPHGRPVEVAEADTTIVSDGPQGRVVAAQDPETGATMMRNLSTETYVPSDMPSEVEEEQGYYDAMNRIEDIEPNPPKRPLFTWRNLRLQQAISGERAVKGATSKAVGAPAVGSGAIKRFIRREMSVKTSIRETPQLMAMATVEDWVTYVENMRDNPIDMGAELSAGVSASQRIAVTKFVAEWEADPGHRALLQKALPGADANDLIARGQLVHALMVGRTPNPMAARGYGTFKYDKMFRLAFDIISTLPINMYNSYTLFNMPALEGEAAFREAVDRYVPLELSEVGMAIELRNKLAEYGPGYAQMAVADPSMSNEVYRLMQQIVNGYNIGDTSVVRSGLNALQDAPFYYMAAVSSDPKVFQASASNEKGLVGVGGIGKKVFNDKDTLYYNGLIFLKDFPKGLVDPIKGHLKNEAFDKINGDNIINKSFEVVRGPFDTTVKGVLRFGSKKNNEMYAEGASIKSTMKRKDKIDAAADMAEALGNPRGNPVERTYLADVRKDFDEVMSLAQKVANETGKPHKVVVLDIGWDEYAGQPEMAWFATPDLNAPTGNNVNWEEEGEIVEPQLNNPRGKPTGRGKFYTLQLHPKGQLSMKLKPTAASGQGDARHGGPPKGKDGSQNTWSKGLYKLLDEDIEKMNAKHRKNKKTRKDKFPKMGVMVTGGKLEKTNKWAPYRIKLPKSHFTVGRTPEGTQRIGLKGNKATPALTKAWQNFTDEYGMFVRKDTKSTEFRFIPSKKAADQGAYFQRVRQQQKR